MKGLRDMSEQSDDIELARLVSARLTERGPFEPEDCVMLIGSTVVGFGHARSDLDLLVSGGTPGRNPFHMFQDGRRVDVDFLYPQAWEETKGRVGACALSVTEPLQGSTPPPVDDRDWWADHLWLYDRVVHGVPITERTAIEFLAGATKETLAQAIANYSRALCARMTRRARLHSRAGNVEAACQYECEALLAAVEAQAATRAITFWSDRTILEKARRAWLPGDPWDPDFIERLFIDLARRAWGSGQDRSSEVDDVLRALLGPEHSSLLAKSEHERTGSGHLDIAVADGWKGQVATGDGFLLAPDRSLYLVSASAARFVMDEGRGPALAWPIAAVLVAAGAAVLEPAQTAGPEVRPSADRPSLFDFCPAPVAPSPESWVSSRVAAQWCAMTVWSLTDDLHGAVSSGHRNRIAPILRKAELFLRMMTITLRSVRSEVSRNTAMDLQGCVVSDDFPHLLDLAYGDDQAEFERLPELATEVFSEAMTRCGMPARPDMFEKSRSFMRQLSDLRSWFRVSEGLNIAITVPATLIAKGGSDSSSAGSAVFVEAST